MENSKFIEHIRGFLHRDNSENAEAVLGSSDKVKLFGEFQKRHSNDLATVQAYFLMMAYTSQNYTVDEMAAYKQGILSFLDFFATCEKEKDLPEREKR